MKSKRPESLAENQQISSLHANTRNTIPRAEEKNRDWNGSKIARAKKKKKYQIVAALPGIASASMSSPLFISLSLFFFIPPENSWTVK